MVKRRLTIAGFGKRQHEAERWFWGNRISRRELAQPNRRATRITCGLATRSHLVQCLAISPALSCAFVLQPVIELGSRRREMESVEKRTPIQLQCFISTTGMQRFLERQRVTPDQRAVQRDVTVTA